VTEDCTCLRPSRSDTVADWMDTDERGAEGINSGLSAPPTIVPEPEAVVPKPRLGRDLGIRPSEYPAHLGG
jgi:hypothetical protein